MDSGNGTMGVKEELLSIKADGSLPTTHEVIKFAQLNPASHTAGHFQWDIEKAAYSDWQNTARKLIKRYIICYEEAERRPLVISLRYERSSGDSYRYIEQVMSEPDLVTCA